jgi:hypothetical protein
MGRHRFWIQRSLFKTILTVAEGSHLEGSHLREGGDSEGWLRPRMPDGQC